MVKTPVRETDWQPFKSLQTILQTNTRTESVSLFRFTSVPPGAPPGAACAALAVLTTPDTSTVQFNAACQKMYLAGGWTKMHFQMSPSMGKKNGAAILCMGLPVGVGGGLWMLIIDTSL